MEPNEDDDAKRKFKYVNYLLVLREETTINLRSRKIYVYCSSLIILFIIDQLTLILLFVRYPFLACEILASEVWAICDAMYQNTALLDELYSYFNKDAPLHPLLSSYTSRVAGVLLTKKVAEVGDRSDYSNWRNTDESLPFLTCNWSSWKYLLLLLPSILNRPLTIWRRRRISSKTSWSIWATLPLWIYY